MKFPLREQIELKNYSDASVRKAEILLTPHPKGEQSEGSLLVNVNGVVSYWKEEELSGYNMPLTHYSYDSTGVAPVYGHSAGKRLGDFRLDITDLLQEGRQLVEGWLRIPYENNGIYIQPILFKGSDNQYGTFCSSRTEYPPVLILDVDIK